MTAEEYEQKTAAALASVQHIVKANSLKLFAFMARELGIDPAKDPSSEEATKAQPLITFCVAYTASLAAEVATLMIAAGSIDSERKEATAKDAAVN